jgi:hypothetical protein
MIPVPIRVPLLVSVLAFGAASALTLESACTAQQEAVLKTGVSTDVQAIACVVATALSSGGDVAVVASTCGVEVATAVEILVEAGEAKPDAGAASTAITQSIVKTKAFADAKAIKAARK